MLGPRRVLVPLGFVHAAALGAIVAGTEAGATAAPTPDATPDPAAPPMLEVRGLDVVFGSGSQAVRVLKGVDLTSGTVPDPEALAKLEELGRTLDSAEVQQATENLEAWARENC